MVNYEVNVPTGEDLMDAEQIIEACCEKEGLHITLKSTLSKYAGCIHYHYQKGTERGTLEVTIWPRENRIWFSIQAGRTADWIIESVSQLEECIVSKMNT
jgi:hypothetical protein